MAKDISKKVNIIIHTNEEEYITDDINLAGNNDSCCLH